MHYWISQCFAKVKVKSKKTKTLLSLQTVPRRGPHRSLAPVVDAKRRCGNQISFARLLSYRLLCWKEPILASYPFLGLLHKGSPRLYVAFSNARSKKRKNPCSKLTVFQQFGVTCLHVAKPIMSNVSRITWGILVKKLTYFFIPKSRHKYSHTNSRHDSYFPRWSSHSWSLGWLWLNRLRIKLSNWCFN